MRRHINVKAINHASQYRGFFIDRQIDCIGVFKDEVMFIGIEIPNEIDVLIIKRLH